MIENKVKIKYRNVIIRGSISFCLHSKEVEIEGVIAYNNYLNTRNSFSASYIGYSDFLDYWLEKYCYINLKYHTIEGYSNIVKNHMPMKQIL